MDPLIASTDRLAELNRDVWHAFVATYGSGDADGFLALYDRDLIRAGGPDRRVHGFDEYARQTHEWFALLAERGDRVEIEFRFTERIGSDDLASERGVFRLTSTRATGEQRCFHDRFHCFLRRTDGRWRIAVDYDSNEAGTVTEDAFLAAAAVDDLDPFR